MIVVTLVTMTMRMIVPMPMAGRLLAVGALLRIEWRVNRSEPRAEPAQHILDHMIAANAQLGRMDEARNWLAKFQALVPVSRRVRACQNLQEGAIRHVERYHRHSVPSA